MLAQQTPAGDLLTATTQQSVSGQPAAGAGPSAGTGGRYHMGSVSALDATGSGFNVCPSFSLLAGLTSSLSLDWLVSGSTTQRCDATPRDGVWMQLVTCSYVARISD